MDYHDIPGLETRSPESIWDWALEVLSAASIPAPSYAVATGRGLALVWLHEPIPRAALPRWRACQHTLYHVLAPLGADRAALDPARVLRVVGSENPKAHRLVKALTPVGRVWDFDALADEILPLTRAELADLRIQRALRRARRPQDKKILPPPRFTTATLWEARLSDLQRLLALRWWGQLPPGQRDTWLFLAGVAMSWLTVSTLTRRLSAISQAHTAHGHARFSLRDELLRSVWAGIQRVHGTASRGKAPVVTADLKAMVARLPDSLLGRRDRALLLLGFAGAFRRSELVGLTAADVQFTADGATVTLRRSKTDQEGQGRRVGIPYGSHRETCPVRALQAWLTAAEITAGPIFRAINRHGQVQSGPLSDKAVALVVKRWARAAGLDPTQYAGHSLRAGLATAAAQAGVAERVIMAQTGHKSERMVRRYIRVGSLFRENAAAEVGL